MNKKNDKIFRLFLRELKGHMGENLKKVILFGSRARGDNTPDSDYDCLIILESVSPSVDSAIDEIAGEFLFEYNTIFSIFSVTQKRHLEQICNPFFINIKKEGITYDSFP